MKPFALALEQARTPAELEAVIVAVNAYFAADPYAVSRTVGGLCTLAHRAEARAARREAYRRLGVSVFVPGSFGREAGGLSNTVVPRTDRPVRRSLSKRYAVLLQTLESGPKKAGQLARVIGVGPGNVHFYLRRMLSDGRVIRYGAHPKVFYRLPPAESAA